MVVQFYVRGYSGCKWKQTTYFCSATIRLIVSLSNLFFIAWFLVFPEWWWIRQCTLQWDNFSNKHTKSKCVVIAKSLAFCFLKKKIAFYYLHTNYNRKKKLQKDLVTTILCTANERHLKVSPAISLLVLEQYAPAVVLLHPVLLLLHHAECASLLTPDITIHRVVLPQGVRWWEPGNTTDRGCWNEKNINF